MLRKSVLVVQASRRCMSHRCHIDCRYISNNGSRRVCKSSSTEAISKLFLSTKTTTTTTKVQSQMNSSEDELDNISNVHSVKLPPLSHVMNDVAVALNESSSSSSSSSSNDEIIESLQVKSEGEVNDNPSVSKEGSSIVYDETAGAIESDVKSNEARKQDVDSNCVLESGREGPTTEFRMGEIAHLADGSAVGISGDTQVHSILVHSKGSSKIPCSSFVPLNVEYRERAHGVGKIPMRINRRDNVGAPSESEVLASRAIDRALRPLFPEEAYNKEDQISLTCSVQSLNLQGTTLSGDPVALAINSASAALMESSIPFEGPVGCVRVCLTRDSNLILDPSPKERKNSVLDLLYAGVKDRTLMIEFNSMQGGMEEVLGDEPAVGIPEGKVEEIIRFAHNSIQPLIEYQRSLRKRENIIEKVESKNQFFKDVGLASVEILSEEKNELDFLKHVNTVTKSVLNHLNDASFKYFCGTGSPEHLSKKNRGMKETFLRDEVRSLVFQLYPEMDQNERIYLEDVSFKRLMKNGMRKAAFTNRRCDGRPVDEVRPIKMNVPMFVDTVHGSSSFARGETQVLTTVTLGSPREGLPLSSNLYSVASENESDILGVEKNGLPVGSLRSTRNEIALLSDLNTKKVLADRQLTGDSGTLNEVKRIFLQYDFPAYCNGEVDVRGNNSTRRSIGHGALAEKAIQCAIPPTSLFPYSVRLTCEVTSSNGSSSMASACGATLALLDAGINVTPIAGLSIGLAASDSFASDRNVKESHVLLFDLTGTEDYYGEMDFKIAGSSYGITAMQLDVKAAAGIPLEVIFESLTAAKIGRNAILEDMANRAKGGIHRLEPRRGLKVTAPRVEVIRFDPIRKRDLIGPSGAVLKQLEDNFGVSLDLSQEGQCLLHGSNSELVGKAKKVIMDLVSDIEEGGIYDGTVIEVLDFGAVVELLRNKEGLLHVSELTDDEDKLSHADGNLGIVRSMLRVGDRVRVLCIGIDPNQGTIKLSRKQVPENDKLQVYSSSFSASMHQTADKQMKQNETLPSDQRWMLEYLKSSESSVNSKISRSSKQKKLRGRRSRGQKLQKRKSRSVASNKKKI